MRFLARALACVLACALTYASPALATEYAEPNMGTGLAEHDTMGTTQLASGGDAVVAIRTDGTTMAWGANSGGQLGDGTTTDRLLPTQVTGLSTTGFRVAMGANFGMSIRLDGTVWTWGDNTYGQLGQGDTTQRSAPTQVTGLPRQALQVFAGDHHAMAILVDGSVYAWGRNDSGQLGDASTLQRTAPVAIGSLAGARSLALGARHSLAILANGNVMSWGANASGQLGIGSTTAASTPQLVDTATATTGARQIAAGGDHSLMIMMDGSVRGWGENGSGQVGVSAPTDQTTPVAIAGANGARSVTAGSDFSAAIMSYGTVVTWGGNAAGQLGVGDIAARTTPTAIAGVANVIAIAAGRQHLVIASADGTVRVTGANAGQVGDGTTRTRLTPYVSSFTWGNGFKYVGAGDTHSIAVRSDGTVWTWGQGTNGKLGHGVTTDQTTPRQVNIPGNPPVRMADTGFYNSIAVSADGNLYIWGDDSKGQIGNGAGDTTDKLTPVAVPLPCSVRAAWLLAGAVIVLCSDGTSLSWGDNAGGALAIGSTTDRNAPATAPNLDDLRQISTRYGLFGHALRANGVTIGWGQNTLFGISDGTVGDGSTTNRTNPVTIAATNARQLVAGGQGGGIARGSAGAMTTWGENGNGFVGDGSTTDRTAPVAQAGGLRSRAATAGAKHTIVMNADGTASAWGGNGDGELGSGATGNALSPVASTQWGNHRMLAAGGFHTVGLSSTGVLRANGRNTDGQVGDGTTTGRVTAVSATSPAAPADTRAPVPNPASGDGVGTSTTQITWTVDQGYDETALHATLPYSVDTGSASWQASRTLVENALTVNTQYTRTMRIRDAALNISTGTVTGWTWAGVPASPSATPSWNSTDGNRVLLSWSAPTGGATSYVVRSSLDSYASALTTTAAFSFAHTALAANTAISYRICAINGGGIETPAAGCATVSVTTPPAAPTAVAIGNLADTTFDVTWTAPAGATNHDVRTYSDAACTTQVDSDLLASSPFAQTGLLRDRTYRVTVRAFSTASNAWGAPSGCIAPTGVGRSGLTVGVSSPTANLGSGAPGTPLTGTTTVTVDSYAAPSFDLQAFKSAAPTSGIYTVPDTTSGTLATPGAWSGTGFGFTISSAPGLPGKWGAGANFAPLPDTSTAVYTRTGMAPNTANTTSVVFGYRLVAPPSQAVGTYATTITYVAVATA